MDIRKEVTTTANYSTITIAAKVTINGQDGIVGVVVKRTNSNNFKMLRILSRDDSDFSFFDEIKNRNSMRTEKGLPLNGHLPIPQMLFLITVYH